jgi:hypothetical protein|tara:strand:- start:404 stop:568 length:165 start_codon:yes stop_codon:yes gene_type:complete
MWVLVWIQLISGKPAEYFQLGVYDTKAVCEQVLEKAEMMVTHNGIAVACLGVKT